MWSRLLNLLVIQVFVLQSFAFAASPGKYVNADQLQRAVSALKLLDKDEQQKLYLSILPMINKEDIKTVKENDLLKTVLNTMTAEGDKLVFWIGNEKAEIADIDLVTWTAKLNGKPFSLKKSAKEQLPTFLETETQTSYLDFIISSAHAQENVPVPNKLKVIGLVIVGSVVAIAAVGAGVWAWVSPKKGSDTVALTEVQSPTIEEVLTTDCNEQKRVLKSNKLGQKSMLAPDFVKKIKDKIAMLEMTKKEAIKQKMKPQDMKWIDQAKTCYDEVITLSDAPASSVVDDSSREIKEVIQQSQKKAPVKKASKQ